MLLIYLSVFNRVCVFVWFKLLFIKTQIKFFILWTILNFYIIVLIHNLLVLWYHIYLKELLCPVKII